MSSFQLIIEKIGWDEVVDLYTYDKTIDCLANAILVFLFPLQILAYNWFWRVKGALLSNLWEIFFVYGTIYEPVRLAIQKSSFAFNPKIQFQIFAEFDPHRESHFQQNIAI